MLDVNISHLLLHTKLLNAFLGLHGKPSSLALLSQHSQFVTVQVFLYLCKLAAPNSGRLEKRPKEVIWFVPSRPTSPCHDTLPPTVFFSSKGKKNGCTCGVCLLELRKVAVLALSPPTAAGAMESNWSTYSFIVNMQRKRLEPERLSTCRGKINRVKTITVDRSSASL